MILIITNRQDYTADFLILELQRRSVDYARFNTEDYPQHSRVSWKIDHTGVGGYFLLPKRKVDFGDIKSIWYRRPVPPVPATTLSDPEAAEFALIESQEALNGVWRSLDCFWVSHPDNLRRAEFKLSQLKLATQVGFRVPHTVVTNIPDEAKAFYSTQGRSIYKTLRQGRIVSEDRMNLIYTSLINPIDAEKLDDVSYAPSLFQEYVQKKMDLRVTVIGSKVFAVEIHSQNRKDSEHDWRRGDPLQLQHKLVSLPPDIEANCVNLVKRMGLAFGAIDLIQTQADEYVFLEINPNGQWAWIQQVLPDIPLRESLAELLIQGKFDASTDTAHC